MKKSIPFVFLFVITVSLGISINPIYAETSYDGSGNIDCAVTGINIISAYTTVHDPVTVTICVTEYGPMQIFYAPHHLTDNCNGMQQELDRELSYGSGDYNNYQLVSDTHWAFIIYESDALDAATESIIKQIEDLDLAAKCSESESQSSSTPTPSPTPAATPTPSISDATSVGKYAIYEIEHIFKTLDILDFHLKGFIKFEINSFDSNSNTYDITTTTYLGESSSENIETVSASELFSIDEFIQLVDADFLGDTSITSSKSGNQPVLVNDDVYDGYLVNYDIQNTYKMDSQTNSNGDAINPLLNVNIFGNKHMISDFDIPYSLNLGIENMDITGFSGQPSEGLKEFTNEIKQTQFSVNIELVETNFLTNSESTPSISTSTPAPTPKAKIIKFDKTLVKVKKSQPDSIRLSGELENPTRGQPFIFKLIKPDGTTEEFASVVTGKGMFANEIIVDNSWKSGEYTIEGFYQGEKIESSTFEVQAEFAEKVPTWIKNNAKWWADGLIGDSDFTSGIQHLIKEKIITITNAPTQTTTGETKVPDWIKNNAGWWADGLITEDDFLKGIEYLVKNGIIRTN